MLVRCVPLLPRENKLSDSLLEAARWSRECLISRGATIGPPGNGAEGYELLYEDDSDTPFSLMLGATQVDRLLPTSDSGKSVLHTIWTRGFRDTPNLAWTMPGKFRSVATLPYLKAWGK